MRFDEVTLVGERGWKCRVQQGGASLIFMIATIVVIGALGAGVVLMTSGSSQNELAENRHLRAYYLALSGQNVWPVVKSSLTSGTTYTYTLGSDSFTLLQSVVDQTNNIYTVSSQGIVSGGAPLEANFPMTYISRIWTPGSNDTGNEITFASGFSTVHPENKPFAITVFDPNQSSTPSGYDPTVWAQQYAAHINDYGGKAWVRFSNDLFDSNGAIWFTGNHGICTTTDCPAGTCKNGKCGLGKGFRAVFKFKFHDMDDWSDSRRYADVMTFAIMSAKYNNPSTACGGPASNISLGEYLGYAGMGPYGVGIRPPKFGVEVDTWPNPKEGDPCSGDPTSVDSRCDHSNANHVAVIFWGNRTDTNYGDDNRHGAGGSSSDKSPMNPYYISSSAADGYREVVKGSSTYNWLEDGQDHTFRIEVWRDPNDRTAYRIKVWIDSAAGYDSDFLNVNADYVHTDAALRLDYTFSLYNGVYKRNNYYDHDDLSQIYFGWTEGTGGATQNADIHNFKLEFRQ